MERAAPISRKLLREEVRAAVLDAVLDGRLGPETHVQEHALSRELHVSRTPLREALIKLELQGFLVRDRASRLSVRCLSVKEVEGLHDLLGALEAFALRRDGLPAPDVLEELSRVADALEGSDSPRSLVELDRSWHRMLLGRCRNEELWEQHELTRQRLARYELFYLRAVGGFAAPVHRQKQDVLGPARAGRTRDAAASLEIGWRARVEPISKILFEARSPRLVATSRHRSSEPTLGRPHGAV